MGFCFPRGLDEMGFAYFHPLKNGFRCLNGNMDEKIGPNRYLRAAFNDFYSDLLLIKLSGHNKITAVILMDILKITE